MIEVWERRPDTEGREFSTMLAEVREGSEAAVWDIIETYEPHIQRVVRRRMSKALRSKFDTADFVQMVWKSFFEHPRQIHEFAAPQQLMAFLVRMAMHKVDTENRRRLDLQKYNVKKEQSLDDDVRVERPGDRPSQIAIAREHWDLMMQKLPNHHREVVRLRLEGLTFSQIAERLGLSERTPRRVLKDLLAETDTKEPA